MSKINLDEGKIFFENQWLSVDELTSTINNNIRTNNFKFANIALALEELSDALDNSHTIDIKLVITKAEFEKLKAIGGDDQCLCIRKAIESFIDKNNAEDAEPFSSFKKKTSKPDDHQSKTIHEAQPLPENNVSSTRPGMEKKSNIIRKCFKCKSKIEFPVDTPTDDVKCPNCHGTGYWPLQNGNNSPRYVDHFMG